MELDVPPQILTKEESTLVNWKCNVFDGQWYDGPIPKVTPYMQWNRRWEGKVSRFACMEWDLFALEPTKARDELLPFVRQLYPMSQYKKLRTLNSCFERYVLQLDNDVFQDGNVENNNVAGFINSSM